VAIAARLIAQDEAISIVGRMPGFAPQAGISGKILPLEQIGPEIVHRLAWNAMQAHATR